MNDINKDLIFRWYQKSQQGDGDVFDRFISLWIPFNAYYAANSLRAPEHDQLEQFQSAYKNIFSSIVRANPTQFEEFKKYIATKPKNTGFIQDLRYKVVDEKHKKRYHNIASLCEYLSCVHQIRCNLFHGGKDIADAQDKDLVGFAFSTLSIFLKRVFNENSILPKAL